MTKLHLTFDEVDATTEMTFYAQTATPEREARYFRQTGKPAGDGKCFEWWGRWKIRHLKLLPKCSDAPEQG